MKYSRLKLPNINTKFSLRSSFDIERKQEIFSSIQRKAEPFNLSFLIVKLN